MASGPKPPVMERSQANQLKSPELDQERRKHGKGEHGPRKERREKEQSRSESIPTPSPHPETNQNTYSWSPSSSDGNSPSHGSSPRDPPPPLPSDQFSQPPQSQPSHANSRPPAVVVNIKISSDSPDWAATGGSEGRKPESNSRRLRPDLSLVRKTERENTIKKILLAFRVSGFAFCLISFSVLAADRNQGWALDSFYEYMEFRYSMAVNVIGFIHSGLQAYDLTYGLATGKQKTHLRHYLDFSLDQILSYLILSASTSAAVRVDDWQSNWGKDKFPDMAKASVALSFIAFASMAASSVLSGYALCTLNST